MADTALDNDLRPAVVEILDEVGKEMTFSADTETYDPATGAVTVSATKAHTVKASPPLEYNDRLVDGEIIERGDTFIFLAAKDLAFTPVKSMNVSFDSTQWQVVAVKKHYSGNQIAAYELQLRS
jgi:hypothetical protein